MCCGSTDVKIRLAGMSMFGCVGHCKTKNGLTLCAHAMPFVLRHCNALGTPFFTSTPQWHFRPFLGQLPTCTEGVGSFTYLAASWKKKSRAGLGAAQDSLDTPGRMRRSNWRTRS